MNTLTNFSFSQYSWLCICNYWLSPPLAFFFFFLHFLIKFFIFSYSWQPLAIFLAEYLIPRSLTNSLNITFFFVCNTHPTLRKKNFFSWFSCLMAWAVHFRCSVSQPFNSFLFFLTFSILDSTIYSFNSFRSPCFAWYFARYLYMQRMVYANHLPNANTW